MENIQLITTPSFKLSQDEIKAMYLRLALCQYQYLRNPNYKKELLIRKLTADFKKLVSSTKELVEQNPNNHKVRQMASFFDVHYKNLITLQK